MGFRGLGDKVSQSFWGEGRCGGEAVQNEKGCVVKGVAQSLSDPLTPMWEFPKIGGTLFGGPCNKDPTI